MKRFFNTYAGRYTIFGLCLFLIVIGFSVVEGHFRIGVTFSDTEIAVTSNRYNMQVEYDLIASAELVEMPDRGEHIDGKDETSIRYGAWKNEAWGDYVVVAVPNATNCVVMHLHDGRTFVFNARSNDYTAELFTQLQSHLAG